MENIITIVSGVLEFVFRYFDPSLFQNIILGMLAIFIPFAIVLLTDILGSKKQRSDFEKMVLTEEVFGVKKLFWLSVVGIVTLSFFANGKEEVSVLRKLLAVIFTAFLIWQFWKSFRSILRFSGGDKYEFEISFLKGLPLEDKMIKAWNSLWSGQTERDEREFTKIFVKHIDNAIEHKKFNFAIQLSQCYQRNLESREKIIVGIQVLPKCFEWTEKFWCLDTESRQREEYDQCEYWSYFIVEFFPVMARILLLNKHNAYFLFNKFKQHVEHKEKELEKWIEDSNDEKRDDCWNYIKQLFSSFFVMFFENVNINEVFISREVFPEDWKITAENSTKNIPRIVLHEFLRWSRNSLFSEDNSLNKNSLSEIANELFPYVDPRLFSVFLPLYYSSEIKEAIVKNPPTLNIMDMPAMSYWSESKSEEEIRQSVEECKKSQEQGMIDIIFNLFDDWKPLHKRNRSDYTNDELSNWDKYTEEQKNQIIARIQKLKFHKIQNELNSPDIKEFCEEEEVYEKRREEFANLIKLMIERIDSQPSQL